MSKQHEWEVVLLGGEVHKVVAETMTTDSTVIRIRFYNGYGTMPIDTVAMFINYQSVIKLK